MKKKILLAAGILFSLLSQNNLFAQQSSGFSDVKGVNVLNAGIGIGSYGMSGTGGLPITASFEHGFSKNISAGVNLGLVHKSYADYWKYNYLLIGVRGSYHLGEALKIANPNVDVYAGAGLLYRRFSVKYGGSDSELDDYYGGQASSGDMTIDLHAGGRYLFNNHLGAFAEVGYGISPLQLGLTVKF